MRIVMHIASTARHKTYTLASRRHLVKQIRYFAAARMGPVMFS
jgi:hypothetical protein